MAGVSLALRRMLGSPFYAAQAAGYLYAAVAMTGPWLLTSLTILLLPRLGIPGFGPAEQASFQSLALYGYCGSMLLTGTFQLVVARYVSDSLYVGETGRIAPSYAASALLSLVLHAGGAAAFAAITRPAPLLAAAEAAFFGSVGLVWTGMTFLGTIRNFMAVAVAFAAGMAVSFLASSLLAAEHGVAGALAGFAAGHAVIAALFAARLRLEFPSRRAFDWGFLRAVGKYPALVAIGIAYAAGVWIDKIIFWASPYAVPSEAGLPCFPVYDNAVFLAYLTVVPSLALVFVRLEASFHDRYWSFYSSLREGADLAAIRACRREILRSFGLTVRRVIAVQGLLTLAAIVWAPEILAALRLDGVEYYVFRTACLGAFEQALLLALLLAAIHLAFYRLALAMTAVYFVVAAAVTAWTLRAGVPYYGFGYAAAGLAGLAVAYPLLKRTIRNLEVRTFMSQPL